MLLNGTKSIHCDKSSALKTLIMKCIEKVRDNTDKGPELIRDSLAANEKPKRLSYFNETIPVKLLPGFPEPSAAVDDKNGLRLVDLH